MVEPVLIPGGVLFAGFIRVGPLVSRMLMDDLQKVLFCDALFPELFLE